MNPGNSHLPNKILDAVILLDFSDRQRRIVLFMARILFGVGEKGSKRRRGSVITNKFRLAGAVGIPRAHIKGEIFKLSEAKVIRCDESTDQIFLNCNVDEWQVGKTNSSRRDLFNKVLSENIREFQTGSVSSSDTYGVPKSGTYHVSKPGTSTELNSSVLKESNKEIDKEKYSSFNSCFFEERAFKDSGLTGIGDLLARKRWSAGPAEKVPVSNFTLAGDDTELDIEEIQD